MKLNEFIYKVVVAPSVIWRKCIYNPALKKSMKYCGKNVLIGKNFTVAGAMNISIGEGTAIGPNCVFYSTLANLTIGKGVLISPNVTIISGEHRTDIIGEYMRNVSDEMKKPENDKDIVIEDDVWIGSNVTIMKGVTIGRGSIIHAGAVISRKIKPYTIYVSDKMKINRFTDEQIQEHEKILKDKYGVEYPEYHPKNDKLFS